MVVVTDDELAGMFYILGCLGFVFDLNWFYGFAACWNLCLIVLVLVVCSGLNSRLLLVALGFVCWFWFVWIGCFVAV